MLTKDRDAQIFKVVSEWAKYTNSGLGKMIERRKIGRTHNLVRSRSYQVHFEGSTPNSVSFRFLAYGQFPDMGVGKGQKLGDVRGNSQIMTAAGLRGRRAKKWYSKTIFPEANTLSMLLNEQFGLKSIEMIHERIDSVITLNF